ncbi:hypothetical protein [Actinoplanes regularis]|uniref:hypothetical protein n=1 Tax=Actinoplanes regularis TaxID=52697 RepID=UPI0024A398FF|nr:hypothetical protein [Actinoplanes regularis]GLW30406.1 hypothetical protein Areg01_33460 [Actinoplanes regularis]
MAVPRSTLAAGSLGYHGPTDLAGAHARVDIGDLARPRLTHHPVHTALIGPLTVAQVPREAYSGQDVTVPTF